MKKNLARAKHPTQPLRPDKLRLYRFKRNGIVSYLLDWATSKGMGLNEIAALPFPKEDRVQFAQLIGYSIVGFGELSYVSDVAWNRALEENGLKQDNNGAITPKRKR